MDKRGETHYERLVKILVEADRPLQTKEFHELLRQAGSPQSTSAMTTMLSHFVKIKRLYKWKAPGLPSFYCLPSWVRSDKKNTLKFNFDPYLKKRIDEPKNNSV